MSCHAHSGKHNARNTCQCRSQNKDHEARKDYGGREEVRGRMVEGAKTAAGTIVKHTIEL